jgi:hypothetical protein
MSMKRVNTTRGRRRYILGGVFIATATLSGLALNGCGGGNTSAAQLTAAQAFEQTCSGLVGKPLATGTVVSASIQPASATQPEMCSVLGKIVSSSTSTINFEIDMPTTASWNKKTLQEGGGGFDGSIADYFGIWQTNDLRNRGYVIALDDSGHQSASSGDLSFALNNPSGLNNFLYASIPLVHAATEAATQLVYGAAPTYRYFFGASTGGREAMQQAQRYAQNYDGILALEPVLEYSEVIQKGLQVQQQILNQGGTGWMDANKIKLFETAQLSACDALDGIADGIISNLQACTFDPKTLRCPGGTDSGDSCLSDAQIASVTLLTTDSTLPVSLANGVTIAPRWGMGAESDSAGGWSVFQLGTRPTAISSALGVFSDQWVKYAITENANTNLLTYNPTNDVARWQAVSSEDNATNPDMSAFAAHGGKLILWHGLSDHLVEVYGTIAYYNKVAQTMGQSATDGFMRFYTSPGVTHSGTGPGAPMADRLTALENWVEKGVAPPDQLVASKLNADGSVALTRPMCRYPAWPKYNGSGDANSASSFTCATS